MYKNTLFFLALFSINALWSGDGIPDYNLNITTVALQDSDITVGLTFTDRTHGTWTPSKTNEKIHYYWHSTGLLTGIQIIYQELIISNALNDSIPVQNGLNISLTVDNKVPRYMHLEVKEHKTTVLHKKIPWKKTKI